MSKPNDTITYYWDYPRNTTSKIASAKSATIYTTDNGHRIFEIDGQLWKAALLVNIDPIEG
jgi:hypothetical protein